MSDQLQVHGPRFTVVPDWVLALPISNAGFRLYVVLLSFAGKDSTSFPSLRTISERMRGASPRQLRRLRAELEESGLLTVIERTRENGSQTSNLYVVNTLPNPQATWDQVEIGEEDTGVRGDPDTDDRGTRTRVSPPEGESVEVESGGTPPVGPPARVFAALTVDKRRASVEEMELGGTLLEMWNGLSGQRLRSPDFVKLFIRRCREHPEVTLEQHESLIRSLLTDPDPWWQGHPSPNLVYGSSAQFERQLTALEAPARRQRRRYGTGVTTGELTQLADKLRREGR